MDSRLRGNDKENKNRKKMDSRLRGNDKENKNRKKMDSRLRGNDKGRKTEKKNMGKMPMLQLCYINYQKNLSRFSRVS